MLARPLAYLRQGFSCAEAEFSGFWGGLEFGCGAASVGGAAFAGAVARGQMELAPFGWRAERRPGGLLVVRGQMELAPFGLRVGSLPGVLLVAAGQMELASFGSSPWVKRPSPGQAARPDAVAKTGADVTDRPRA